MPRSSRFEKSTGKPVAPSDLPGAEHLDIEKCLATLDRWAESVRHETERHLYKYRNNPAEFKNSEGYFRMLMLITVLQQDFQVHYNPERIRTVDFTNSQDLFLHGMIPSGMIPNSRAKANGGTCVSLPVLYTAVARRLGYPVSLVAAKEHVFCRWDSPEDRFNIEATNQGLSCYDDEYYKTWPKPMTEAEVEAGLYLKSLDAAEAFAMFLAARGHCLEDNHLGAKARVAYAMAAEKQTQNPLYFGYLAQTMSPPRQGPEQFTPRHPATQPLAYQPHHPNPLPNGRAASDPYPQDVFKPNLRVDPFAEQQSGLSNPVHPSFP